MEDKKARRNELARKRYYTVRAKRSKEYLEYVLDTEPSDEVSLIAYDLLGSGEYMKGLDIKTKKMLDEHITPVNNNK
jgi:hypothetical protein